MQHIKTEKQQQGWEHPCWHEKQHLQEAKKTEVLLNRKRYNFWFITVYTTCVCMLSCFSHVGLFVPLWTVACQAPLSTEFPRQEYWSGLVMPSSSRSSCPRDRTRVSNVSCISRWVFTTNATLDAYRLQVNLKMITSVWDAAWFTIFKIFASENILVQFIFLKCNYYSGWKLFELKNEQ